MQQRRRALWAIAALLLIASIAVPAFGEDAALSEDDSEFAEEEKAFLIVRKTAVPKESVVGSNLTVVIEVHNAGTRSVGTALYYLRCINIIWHVPSVSTHPCMIDQSLVPCAISRISRERYFTYQRAVAHIEYLFSCCLPPWTDCITREAKRTEASMFERLAN